MGCDIHFYIEENYEPNWYEIMEINIPRNYQLFACLAGVRNSWGIEPMILPRGLPDDLSKEMLKIHLDSDAHTESWMTLKELADIDRSAMDIECPTCHKKHSKTYRELLPIWFVKLIEFLESYPGDLRVVFWFDN